MSKKKITICLLLLAIGTIAFLPCLTFQKEQQTFTESNDTLAVFLGEEKSKTFPSKDDGYVYDHTECTNDEVATWNADTWKLSVGNIKKSTKCNVYFTLGFTGKEFAYTGAVEEFIVPVSGNYKLEVWGASGGDSSGSWSGSNAFDYKGGKGGYSVGTVYLEKETPLYIYIGGQGGTTTEQTENKGGFNGGGSSPAFSYSSVTYHAGGGGGATDIRIGEDTLYHRVIVAGGGGGAGCYNYKGNTAGYGGAGGGNEGVDGSNNGPTVGTKGTQSTGYAFGIGGAGLSSNGKTSGAGGGGGWYGGTGSTYGGSIHNSGGGGGSGWIYTESAFNTWQAGNTVDATNWKLDIKYHLSDAQTITGAESIPTYDGLDTMTGNEGNGYAKITLIS